VEPTRQHRPRLLSCSSRASWQRGNHQVCPDHGSQECGPRQVSCRPGGECIEIRLVEELLEVYQLELHTFELLLQRENMVTIVQEIVANQQLVMRTRQIELVVPSEEVVPVLADAGRIGQAPTNYLSNALKYAPVEQPIEVRLEVKGSFVRVSVRDQGPGLTPEQQQRVWERFYQVAAPGLQGPEGGLGLGLAIARALVEERCRCVLGTDNRS
jgi:signal transduction histidine kinase